MLPIKELIAQKKALVETTRQLDEHLESMLIKKRELLDKVDELKAQHITPLTEEISQIDAEIEHIFKETGITKASCYNYTATLSTEIKYQVTDKDKVLDFIKRHPTALKVDILNSKEMNRLYKDGVVPNPEKDGIKCNDNYQKITFRKK